jgi:hypothetical protein
MSTIIKIMIEPESTNICIAPNAGGEAEYAIVIYRTGNRKPFCGTFVKRGLTRLSSFIIKEIIEEVDIEIATLFDGGLLMEKRCC